MFKRVLLVMVVLSLMMMPMVTLGQDVPPDLVQVPDDMMLVHEWVFVAAVVILGAVMALLGASLLGLYRSLPPALQTLIEAILPPLVRLAEQRADATPNKIDDAGTEQLKNKLIEWGLLPPDNPQPPNLPPSQPPVDAAASRPGWSDATHR